MRYFIEFAYNGTRYHGWQMQPNAITIQETLQKAMHVILKQNIELVGAGRTDAGVHAKQLFAHFDYEKAFDKVVVVYKLNAILPADIVVKNMYDVVDDAHARFDAISRSYEYYINYGKNPFNTELTWQLKHKKLNVKAMNEAAKVLQNYTNFKSFSRSKTDVKTYNCKVYKAFWKVEDEQLIFYITADRFLRNMVRAIVGTLVEIGEGKTTISNFEKIIESVDRTQAGPSAPAQGLFLTSVKYPENTFKNE